MELISLKGIIRVLISGFLLNGSGAVIGLAKMGIVSHAINPSLLPHYFLDLAIWGWFAINGESVRQFWRQSNEIYSWKLGLISIKQEWKLLVPFTLVIVVSTQFTTIFNIRIHFAETLVTIFSGWVFVYTSTFTGLLEAKGKVEIANWVTLGCSILTLPVFVIVANHAEFDSILGFYFFLNLINGFLHMVVLGRLRNPSNINSQASNKIESNEFKKILILESIPRIIAPFLIANLSSQLELSLYTVLVRIFLIYGIFAVSINPILALKGKVYSVKIVDGVIHVIGPCIFIISTLLVILFSQTLVGLVGATKVVPSFWDFFSFSLLGAVSILTQPFIGSVISGHSLILRRQSAVLANLAGFIFLPIQIFLWGSIGAFYSLTLFQVIYFALLKFQMQNLAIS
jgi:hypothetical protein